MDKNKEKKENRFKVFLRSKFEKLKDLLNEQANEIKNVKSKRILAIASASFLLIAFIVCYFTIGEKLQLFFKDKEAFNLWLTGFGKWGRIIFVTIRAIQTIIKIVPGEPLEIAAGYAFGIWGGLFYCSLGTFLGSLVIVALTKKFGIKLVELFVPPKTIKSMEFLKNKKNLNLSLTIIYLIPSTPKDIITYLYALTDESMVVFFLITTVCRIPSIITSTICGSALEDGKYGIAIAVFALTAVCGIGGATLYAYISGTKKKKEKNDTADESAGNE